MRKTELANRVAVITAATSGIGLALAMCAVQRGMKVAMVDHDRERLAAALKRVREKQPRSIAFHMDVSDLGEVRDLARCIEAELGPPWLVCNTCESCAESNVRAVTHGVQVFAPILAERGEGHIVNIVSADVLSSSCPALRAAALHAIVGTSESLFRELDILGSAVGVSLVGPALGDISFKILSAEGHNCAGHPVRTHAGGFLRPERLAEEIFDAVTARRFRIFSNGPEASGIESPAKPRCLDAVGRQHLQPYFPPVEP